MGHSHSQSTSGSNTSSNTDEIKISSMHASQPVLGDTGTGSPGSGTDIDSDSAMTTVRLFRLNSTSNTNRISQASISVAGNGVTGTYIAPKICSIAATFWFQNIEKLHAAQQLEIGCSILFSMLSCNAEIKQLMKVHSAEQKIGSMGVKLLDMFSWLIRHLIADNIDLCVLLNKLGAVHQTMGVKITHFDPMLQAMHETFTYYFDKQYTVEVKYAFDEIFALAAQIMTGQILQCGSHLNVLNAQFQAGKIPFLQSLDVCLQSNIGKEYLYRYLQQMWCDEMVIFLKSLARFKSSPSDKERFMIAREIVKTSVRSSAEFAVNISFENRSNSIDAMQELEEQFAAKQPLAVCTSLFAAVEAEVLELISENHWYRFMKNITSLQGQSCSVE